MLRNIKGFQTFALKCKNNDNGNALLIINSVSQITNSITATVFEITNSVYTLLPHRQHKTERYVGGCAKRCNPSPRNKRMRYNKRFQKRHNCQQNDKELDWGRKRKKMRRQTVICSVFVRSHLRITAVDETYVEVLQKCNENETIIDKKIGNLMFSAI